MTTTDQTYRLFIDGEWIEPAAGAYPIVNPATEQVIGRAPEASPDQVRDAVPVDITRQRHVAGDATELECEVDLPVQWPQSWSPGTACEA